MPNPIETDIELAKSLGILAGRWGQCEFMVEMIYSTIAEMPFRKATITFSFFKSIPTQKDIIHFIADETVWLGADDRKTLKSAVTKFSNMSARRNGYIHYPFGLDSEDPEGGKIYKGKRSRTGEFLYSKEPTSPKDIMSFADEVMSLHRLLSDAHQTALTAYERKLQLPPLDQIRPMWSLRRLAPEPE